MNRSLLYTLTLVIAFVSCKTQKSATSNSVATPSSSSSQKLSEKDAIDFEYIFFNANKEKMLGNYSLAATLFLQCVKIDPTSATPYYELSNIYTYNNEKDKALECAAKSAILDPKNNWYQLLYADCLQDKKKYSEAAAVYQTILKNSPDKIEYYYELADLYLAANKPQDALKTYDKIEEKIGVNDQGNVQKVRIYRQLKSSDKSLKELEKLIKAFPNESKYYGMLGEIYEETNQKEKAIQAYNTLMKVDPGNPFGHLSLGEYYYSEKQPAKALEEYKLAFVSKRLDIDTKVKILLNYYAVSELKTELRSDALVLCRLLVETHPDEAKSYSMYGDLLYRDKLLKEARGAYRKANELDKSKYAIWNQILIIDSELTDTEAMLTDSKLCIELFPTQPLPYLFNGLSNIQKKKYKEAIDVLNEGKGLVLENKPLSSQFYASLGDANHSLKNYKESDEAYDKALEIDPKNIYVLNNYAYYLSVRNEKLEKAEAMSKKTNELEPNNNSYLDTYGWILYQSKKYSDAKIWIEKALENGGRNNSVILEHYGDILYQLGDKEKALEYWIEAKKKGQGSDFLDKKVSDKKLYE